MKAVNSFVEYSDYIPLTMFNTKKNKMEVTMSLLTTVELVGKTRSATAKKWDEIIKAVNKHKVSEVMGLLGVGKALAGHYIRQTRKSKDIALLIEANKLQEAGALLMKHIASATDEANVLAMLNHFYGNETLAKITHKK